MSKITEYELENPDQLVCQKCNVPLVEGKVFLSYLGNNFPTKLLKCPKCGLCFISEELAMVKASQVERTMEEK